MSITIMKFLWKFKFDQYKFVLSKHIENLFAYEDSQVQNTTVIKSVSLT